MHNKIGKNEVTMENMISAAEMFNNDKKVIINGETKMTVKQITLTT